MICLIHDLPTCDVIDDLLPSPTYHTFYAGFDEISTGLDSAATYDIIQLLSTVTKAFKYTMAISLLQPPPEVFKLFDEVLVMREGRLVYQGRRVRRLESRAG